MKRIYHPFEKWEDWQNGMWRYIPEAERQGFIREAAKLMIDCQRFLEAMQRVTQEWTCACEHNLTTIGINRHAFMGHCACALETGSPEDSTRQAWHTLNQEQQDWANLAADIVIQEWEAEHKRKLTEQCQSTQLELMS